MDGSEIRSKFTQLMFTLCCPLPPIWVLLPMLAKIYAGRLKAAGK
jgi:hypothetical protein